MSGNAYWKNRQARLMYGRMDDAEVAARSVARIYAKASEEITQRMRDIFRVYKDKWNLTEKEAKRLLSVMDDGFFNPESLRRGINTIVDVDLRNQMLRDLETPAYQARLRRLQELQEQIDQMMVDVYKQDKQRQTEHYINTGTDTYYRGIYDVQRQVGFQFSFAHIDRKAFDRLLKSKWSGKNYSTRIWENTQHVADTVKEELMLEILTGKALDDCAEAIQHRFQVGAYESRRLIRTESNFVSGQMQQKAYEECGADWYEYVATLDSKTDEECGALDGKRFKCSEAQPGVNMNPMHPFCVLPDTKIIAPDTRAMTKSYYSGNIVEMRTANGARLTVTANHIVLTARGWVRAKDLTKGDKVIHYVGWDEFVRKANPTHNNGIPVVEECFTALVKSGAVASVSVPVAAEYLKGDVSVDGEINIISIDSTLRDKTDPTVLKFFGDVPLVLAGKAGKIPFDGGGSLSAALIALALAFDGVVSSDAISSIFFGGPCAHHELVGFLLGSNYNIRLYESSMNDRPADIKLLRESFFTDSGFIEFDNLVDIKIRYFSGHVYDVTSFSTLYIANGIITSNCRCTTVIVLDDDVKAGLERRARDPKTGKLVKVPASTNYIQWAKDNGLQVNKKIIGGNNSKEQKKENGETVENKRDVGIIKPDKIISGHSGTPKEAERNSIIDHVGTDGKTETRTFYGENALKQKDITTHDHKLPKQHPFGRHGEHAHDYEWNEDGTLKNRTTRELTEKERKENDDIL